MSERVYNILFLCTGNSARSILGKAIFNHVGQGRFSTPKGALHPMTVETLATVGIPNEGKRSRLGMNSPGKVRRRWISFSPFVTTLLVRPDRSGPAMTAHWGIDDPAAVDGPEFKQRAAFEDALRFLRNCIGAFINLPIASIDRMALNSRLEGIGEMEGTTTKSSKVA